MDKQKRATAHYEALVCSNPSCKGYRWADVARLRGETHCLWCNSKFKQLPELRPYYQATGAKGKGKGGNKPSEAKGGKGGKGGNPGKGGKTPKGGDPKSGKKVTQTCDRQKVDNDVVHKARVEYAFLADLHGKESQKARDAYDEYQHQLELRDAERTPSQRATEKRRLLKNLRTKLVKAAALDTAEQEYTDAQIKFAAAETHLETTSLQVDRLEEELQYLEEQYLRPSAPGGPQRDFVTERAHDAVDRAILRGGQDEDTAEVQQLTNRLLELLDKKDGAQPRKKTRFEADMADEGLPPVPEAPDEADKKSEPDEDMDDTYCGPNAKTSIKILAQYSSKATRALSTRRALPRSLQERVVERREPTKVQHVPAAKDPPPRRPMAPRSQDCNQMQEGKEDVNPGEAHKQPNSGCGKQRPGRKPLDKTREDQEGKGEAKDGKHQFSFWKRSRAMQES